MLRYILPLAAATAAAAGLLISQSAPAAGKTVPFRVPGDSTIPAGPAGEQIRLGRAIIRETARYTKGHVGNQLSCTSCHLGAGTQKNAGPYVGVSALFPMYRERAGRMISLEDRVNDCYERSLNGKPLPRNGREMKAITAYMGWLSQGIPKGHEVEGRGFPRITAARPADAAKGKMTFEQNCAMCHGANGQGMAGMPPVWGSQSFNIAAGMSRQSVAAAFIKANMPLGRGNTLSNEQAHDVAAFILSKPRPDYPAKARDWPKGGKPKDSPY